MNNQLSGIEYQGGHAKMGVNSQSVQRLQSMFTVEAALHMYACMYAGKFDFVI